MPRLRAAGIERVTFRAGVTVDELDTFVQRVSAATHAGGFDARTHVPQLAHVFVDRLRTDRQFVGVAADVAAIQQLYAAALEAAEDVWESARTEGQPAVGAALVAVSGLAHAIQENRPALLALTAMKRYDNETFSHMVNVAVLMIAQAQTLGINGQLLRALGLAALMHDLGKVRTPLEILTKPDALTHEEFVIMQRHVVDGAEILQQTPDMLPLAPIVAFEHHLRRDGSGYPAVRRAPLNIGTVLCSIADVYDAMRIQRHYQNAFPTDRILAVLKRSDGGEFDPHLVRRFVQLLGMYPPGTVVRLSTKEVAVVLTAHAPDPYVPQVKVIRDVAGQPIDVPEVRCLWETGGGDAWPITIEAPLDPAEYGVEPLMCF